MFRVTADSLEAYLAFDPNRTADLEKLHALMRRAAPSLNFKAFTDLNASAVSALFAEAADIFKADKTNPTRYMQGN